MDDSFVKLSNYQTESRGLKVGDLVWVSDDVEPYLSCSVEVIKDPQTLIVQPPNSKKGNFKVNMAEFDEWKRKGMAQGAPEPKRVLAQRPKLKGEAARRYRSKEFVDHLDELKPLNEAEVLSYVEGEFRKDRIYTRTGQTLVAVNPFKWMLPAFTDAVVAKYHAGVSDDDAVPHVYQEAENVLRRVHSQGESAHFVLTGVSGSGKTETAKLLFQYLAQTSKMDMQVTGATREGGPLGGKELPCLQEGEIDTLLEGMDVLEAFGNAKTVENENSSRFGIFAQVFFNKNLVMSGARLECLMFEATRVVAPRPEERNFHVFYQLLRGADPYLKAELGAQPVEQYDILHTNTLTAHAFDDGDEWASTLQALASVGFSDEEVRKGIVSALVAVLDLGNLDLEPSTGAIQDSAARDAVCDGLGILPSAEAFEQALCFPNGAPPTPPSEAGEGEYGGDGGAAPGLASALASDARDKLAKAVYSKLFKAVVNRLNDTYAPEADASSDGGAGNLIHIGVLDLPGFENLPDNNLDQLLINLAAEQLQEQFNMSMTQSAELYSSEGASFAAAQQATQLKGGSSANSFGFPSSEPVLSLLSRPPYGALPLLEALSADERSDGDDKYAQVLASYHEGHPKFAECGRDSPWRAGGAPTHERHFGVHHYAGTVIYDSSTFLEHNLDEGLAPALAALLAQSSNALVASLFAPSASNGDGKGGAAAPAATAVSAFNQALDGVLSILAPPNEAPPDLHYIRCLKSNHEGKPDMFDRSFVLEQFNSCGLSSTLAVRGAHGLSYPIEYPAFAQEFDYFLRDKQHLDPGSVLGAAYLSAVTSRGLRKGYTPGRDRAGHVKAGNKAVAAATSSSSAATALVEQQQAVAFTSSAVFVAGEAVMFCRVSEESALGCGKWEHGTFVKRISPNELVVSPADGEVQGELTLGPEQVCFADHYFHSAASILTEMCLTTNVAAEDYRLGRSMVFLNARAYQALTSIVHEMLNCVAARIQRWYLRKSVPGQGSGFRALELIKTMVRVATNSAKKNGVGDHPAFKTELYATKKAIEYAAGVVLFEDSTSEHAAALAREKVHSLVAIEKKLSEEKARVGAQRIEVLRLLDDSEAKLRVVEKFLHDDVQVPRGSLEALIPRVRDELDAHRAHLNAVVAQAVMELVNRNALTGCLTKMLRRASHQVEMLLVMMGPNDFGMTYSERKEAVLATGDLVTEVEDAFRIVEEQQRKFDLAKRAASANLKHAETEFTKLLDRVEETSIGDLTIVQKSMRTAQDSVTNAQIALLNHEPAEFEIACQKASDCVGDLSEVVSRETADRAAATKIGHGRELLQASTKMFREIETDAEILGLLASSHAYPHAHGVASHVLEDALKAEISEPDKYISLAEAFVQQVRQLEAIFRREKGTLETEDLERNEEMDRLRPAVERLNELQTVFEASGIPNYDKVAEAVAKAMEATDAARTAIDGPTQDRPPTRVLRDLVRDAQQLVLVAERTYNEEVDRKAHLERETSAASGELEQVELRLDAVATEIEESGMTVAHLSEEAYSVAENAVAQAKKLLRKNASPGEIRLATQQAIDSVRGAEDSLDKHKSRLVQVQKVRDGEQAKLDAATQLLAQVTDLCDEVGLTDGSAAEVTDTLLAAKSSIRLAQARLARPITVAWMENNEVSGDQAVVKEALARVDDVEEQVYKEKAMLEKLDRESRVNVQLLELGVEKFEALHSMALDEGLASDLAVQSALEEADDAMTFAKKAQATASKAHVLSSRKNIDLAVQRVSKCEEVLFEAKSRRDKTSRGKQEAAVRLERVMADMHAVVATIDAAGPTVSALMEDHMDLAARAVNVAVRHLRNDKDSSGAEFRQHIEHAADVVMQMDDHAAKVRMQATKAEKLKLSAMKQLESLAGTLAAVSDKADSDQLKTQAGVSGHIQNAEATLNLVRRRADVSIEVWMQDSTAISRGIGQTAEAVQRAEESVEDEAGKKDRKKKVRDKMKVELDELHDQLATVRDQIETVGGISTVAAVQEALTHAENELDSILHQFQNGSPSMLSVSTTAEAIHHLQELADHESRKRDRRNHELQATLRALPILQQQLAAVDAMVDSAGPPVGLLVEPDLTHASAAVLELERFVDAGHNFTTKKAAPSVEAATDKCQALEELATRQVKRVNAAHQAMAQETKRLDDLQQRFSEVCELVAAFCSQSDHLRIQLEADWQDICWWGSQVRHTKTIAGGAYGRGELKPIGTVEMITDHMVAADKALSYARKRVEMSVEAWLEQGPATAHAAVDEATMKVETAQAVVDKEHTRLEYEEKQRANGMGELRSHVDKLGSVRALMEDHDLTQHALCKEALRQAEHACAVVGDLYGKGPVSGATPAMEVAIQKVSDVHDLVLSEAQRRERNLAEKAHAASTLEGYRAILEGVQRTHEALGMGDVAYVADAVNRATLGLREAELLVSAESVGLSLAGRAVQRVQGLLEVAERAVGQQQKRQEERVRFAYAREEVSAHRRLRRDYRDKLKFRAEQGERLRMNTELNAEAQKLQQLTQSSGGEFDDVTHATRLADQAVETARIAIDHATLALAQRSVREAQVKIHYAVHYSRSAQLAAGPAIDGRLLADSDLRDRRYLAAGAMNEEPQDNNQGGQENMLSLRNGPSPPFGGADSAFQQQQQREATIAQLEANLMAGVGDRDQQLRLLQELQLPIHAARYSEPKKMSPGARLFPAVSADSVQGGISGGHADSEDPNADLADYRSEQFYGTQDGTDGVRMDDENDEEMDLAAMFPAFPPGSPSLLAQHLTPELFGQLAALTTASGVTLQDCIISGVEHPAAPVGLYAGDAECLVLFEPIFAAIASELHDFDLGGLGMHPASILDAEGVADDLPKDGTVLSCRVSFKRNVCGHSLAPQITTEMRKEIDLTVHGVFASFEGTEFAATKYTLADVSARPDVLSRMSHVSGPHKPLALGATPPEDAVKHSAGLYEDWPHDRSVLVGDDGSFVVNVNGDEHLEVCVVTKDSLLDAFNQAADLLDNMVQSQPASDASGAMVLAFEYNDKFGFVTADPAVLGTAMDCEVHVAAPGRLGAALKAGRLATACSDAALASVDVLPSPDGASCFVRSAKTVGVTCAQMLAFVNEVSAALVEAAKTE